ncbi:unnamed protein product [Alopecurus aequalis]
MRLGSIEWFPDVPSCVLSTLMSLVVFNRVTTVVRQDGIPFTFIQWSYNLTPIRELPLSSETPERLTDVIGMITQISDIGSFHFPRRTTPLCARDVFIQDASGYEIQIRLWGHSAQRFNGESIRDLGQDALVVAIFYDTTVRTYDNKQGLAGGEACGCMSDRFKPVARAPTPEGISLKLQVGNQYPRKTITELINFNFFENEDAMFRCTVRVDRLNLSEEWWQLYCLDCQRPSIALSGPMYIAPYQCRNPNCLSDRAGIRYRVCLICSDETEDAEFVMMGRVAQQAIGAPIMNVLRNNQPDDLPISNLEFAARHAASPPIELAAMVSAKYRFTVVVSNGSFFRPRPLFVVRSVDAHLPLPCCQSSADLIIR